MVLAARFRTRLGNGVGVNLFDGNGVPSEARTRYRNLLSVVLRGGDGIDLSSVRPVTFRRNLHSTIGGLPRYRKGGNR